MNISEISIRRPVFAWMLMFGLIIFGGISFTRMGISQMPDVNFPVVNIALELDNASPGLMETDVVDVIEDAVMGIEGLDSVTSTVSQGHANVTCNFVLGHNIDTALQEVENQISQSANQLPTALYPPIITKTNPEDQPIMWVMVSADQSVPLYKQMIYARNTLKDQLTTIAGVGNIVLGGYVDPQLRVWMDEKKLYKYDLTSSDIVTTITDEQLEQPAGDVENPMREFNIRVLGEEGTPDGFSKLRINTRSGAPNYNPIPLGKVTRVEEGIDNLREISRFDGKTTVGLGIVKQHGSNAVEVADLIYKKIEQLRPTLLPGYHVEVKLDTTKFIKESVNDLNMTLVLAAILTSIVCYLFLGSWSSTLNVLLAIPTSIVGAFIALYFFGFTLNTFTLLGLALAIGIVVDDAIMMLENIVRHQEMGKNRLMASLDGSKEITFAALAATLAIAAIFVPVIFMKGVIGSFFYQYGITVTVAVFLSLLEALTLTPMRCSRFLASPSHNPGFVLKHMDRFMNWLADKYRSSLRTCLNHRWWVVILSVAFFFASMVYLNHLRQELIPEQDQSLFLMTIQNPVGTSIQASDEIFKKAEKYLVSQPEISDYYTTIGDYQGANIVNEGTVYVILKNPKLRKLSQRQVMDRTRADVAKLLPQSQIFMQDLSLAGFSASRGFPIEFTLEGPDWDKLSGYSQALISKLKASGMIEDINTDYQDGMPELHVIPDRDKAADHGVTVNSMENEVADMIGGYRFTANTEYPLGDHRYYIRVRADPDQYADPSDITKVLIPNNRGSSETGGDLVKLPDVAKVVTVAAPQVISRFNRSRAVTVYANVAEGKSQQAALQVVEKAAAEVLPLGYRIMITGSAQAFRDAFESLIFALFLGVVVAYMVLASQFNSFIHPVTVLMALPFSLSGAMIALYYCNQSLNLFSMIGLILLMGIVKKNSILLVDFTNQRRAEGDSPHEALLHACPVRLRPILMTSVACIAGAIPEALNLGSGSETRVPMAVSIIGGLTISTLLTLYCVPCIYSLFTRLERPEMDEEKEERERLQHHAPETAGAH